MEGQVSLFIKDRIYKVGVAVRGGVGLAEVIDVVQGRVGSRE
jgi:hypothetical protein